MIKKSHAVVGYRDEAVFRIFSRIEARSAVDSVGAGLWRQSDTVWRNDITKVSQLGQAPRC
jgi:hypothetical protein